MRFVRCFGQRAALQHWNSIRLRITLRAMLGFLKALTTWLERYQALAIWLEGIALVAILALDWRERIDQRKERKAQHEETAAQLAASQKQVEAAIKSADAATTSANAAQESLSLMRHQFEEQAGIGQSIVQSAIESAISQITWWKAKDLERLARFQGLPLTDNLVPANATTAVDHARRISAPAAQELSAAFDALRTAQSEIESMRHVDLGLGTASGYFARGSKLAQECLESAFANIQKAQATLLFPRTRPY